MFEPNLSIVLPHTQMPLLSHANGKNSWGTTSEVNTRFELTYDVRQLQDLPPPFLYILLQDRALGGVISQLGSAALEVQSQLNKSPTLWTDGHALDFKTEDGMVIAKLTGRFSLLTDGKKAEMEATNKKEVWAKISMRQELYQIQVQDLDLSAGEQFLTSTPSLFVHLQCTARNGKKLVYSTKTLDKGLKGYFGDIVTGWECDRTKDFLVSVYDNNLFSDTIIAAVKFVLDGFPSFEEVKRAPVDPKAAPTQSPLPTTNLRILQLKGQNSGWLGKSRITDQQAGTLKMKINSCLEDHACVSCVGAACTSP